MRLHSYLYALTGLLSLATEAAAQTAAPAAAATPAPTQFNNIMTLILIGACALLFIVAMYYVVKTNQLLYKKLVEMEAAKSGVSLGSGFDGGTASGARQDDGFWTKIRKQYWEDAVPIEREDEILMHHDYDGIRELDNRLPPWWLNMFFLTIVWAAVYMWYYHWGGGGPSSRDEYDNQVSKAKKEIAMSLSSKAVAVDESSVTALTDAAAIGEGELIYKNLCVACHGAKGEGGVGPNFADEYWLHGGGVKNIFKTIKYGVPEKGMISWEAQIKPADMQKVASFILTFQGTNPPNGKAPQGEIWKGDGAAAQDTTAKAPAGK